MDPFLLAFYYVLHPLERISRKGEENHSTGSTIFSLQISAVLPHCICKEPGSGTVSVQTPKTARVMIDEDLLLSWGQRVSSSTSSKEKAVSGLGHFVSYTEMHVKITLIIRVRHLVSSPWSSTLVSCCILANWKELKQKNLRALKSPSTCYFIRLLIGFP